MNTQEEGTKTIYELIDKLEPELQGKSYKECLVYLFKQSMEAFSREYIDPAKGPMYVLEAAASTECMMILEIKRLREELVTLSNQYHQS